MFASQFLNIEQAIKQKLQIHRNRSIAVDGERPSPQEEDKAKMLFGNRHVVCKCELNTKSSNSITDFFFLRISAGK